MPMVGSICSVSRQMVSRCRPSITGRRTITGKSFARVQNKPRATSASTPLGLAAKSRFAPGCWCRCSQSPGPQMHFGLGEQTGVDVARILWPNGSVRAEFALKADQEVVTEQRLKGSCPFLFAYNGKDIEFVKDAVPWGSAIGLRINSLGTARIGATEEWYKIGRDQLCSSQRLLRPANNRRAMGDLLLRLSRSHGRGSSGGHGGLH